MDAVITTIETDSKGNRLYVEGNKIYLETENGKTRERLALIDLEKKSLVIHREYFDYNERFKCYPFNQCLLRSAKKCETVYLIAPEGRFSITVKELLEYGTPLIYGTNDLTNQIFVELSLIKKFPAS